MERCGRHAGYCAQEIFQPGEQCAVAFGLFFRGERVHVAPRRVRQGYHLGCGVQFHGARAERYHRMREGYVAPFQFFDIAHHLCLAAVFFKHFLRQERRFSGQFLRDVRFLRQSFFRISERFFCGCQYVDYTVQIVHRSGLVE